MLQPRRRAAAPLPTTHARMLRYNAAREYERLRTFYGEAAALLAWPDERLFGKVAEISGWSPAQHLSHLTLSNRLIFRNLERLAGGGHPALSEGGPNLAGRLVLRLGRFPRGRARAPKFALPPEDLARADLEGALAHNRAAFDRLAPLLPNLPHLPGRTPHPRFGPLSAVEWLRFTRIHSLHHFAIIHEIGAQQQASNSG